MNINRMKKNDTENLFRNDDGHFHSKAQLKSTNSVRKLNNNDTDHTVTPNQIHVTEGCFFKNNQASPRTLFHSNISFKAQCIQFITQ